MHPILFSVGPLTIYAFGVLIAIGYLLATFLLWRDQVKKGKNPTPLLDMGIGLLLSGLIGGRVLYILLHLQDYLEDPLEIFRIQHGGLVFYGGLAAALLFAIVFIKRKKLPFWEVLDDVIPYAVLVQAFGRVGCFFNGCCYGKPTFLPWGVSFPGSPLPLHPVQLYESSALFLLFGLLKRLAQKRIFRVGGVFLFYLFSYGILRFFAEFLRGDQDLFLWGMTLPQLLSLFLLCVSLFFWRRCKA